MISLGFKEFQITHLLLTKHMQVISKLKKQQINTAIIKASGKS